MSEQELSLSDVIPGGTIPVLLALFLLVGTAGATYEQVGEGFVGVEREFGAVNDQTYSPGPHFTPPWIGVQSVEIRPRTYSMLDSQGEGDKPAREDAIPVDSVNGTSHRVDVTIRYRVDPSTSPAFISEYNNIRQGELRLIRPTVRSTIRDEASGIPSSMIYRQEGRARLETAATNALEQEFEGSGLILEAVQIRDVTVPQSLRTKLNDREAAKIEIETRENDIQVQRREAERQQVEAEADAEVRRIEARAEADVQRIEAEGQADRIRIRGEAYRENPVVLEAEYIEAIGRAGSTIILPGSGTSSTPDLMLDARSRADNSTSVRP